MAKRKRPSLPTEGTTLADLTEWVDPLSALQAPAPQDDRWPSPGELEEALAQRAGARQPATVIERQTVDQLRNENARLRARNERLEHAIQLLLRTTEPVSHAAVMNLLRLIIDQKE